MNLYQQYKDAVLDFIEDFEVKQKLLYGRNLTHDVKLSDKGTPSYIYFECGANYYIHFEIKNFEDWCKEGGLR